MLKPSKDCFFEVPLGLHLKNIAKQYFGVFSKKLSHLELDRHFYTLMLLQRLEEDVNQQQIAELLCIDKTSMVRIIDTLSKQGFVKRKKSKKDRREYQLELTPKAVQCIPEIRKALKESNEETLAGITEEEREFFYHLMNKIACNLLALPAEKVDFNFRRIKS